MSEKKTMKTEPPVITEEQQARMDQMTEEARQAIDDVARGAARKNSKMKSYFKGLGPAMASIAIPAAKRFALEAFRVALRIDDRDPGYSGGRSRHGDARVSYRQYYDDSPFVNPSSRTKIEYNDVTFTTRLDAERVLNEMNRIITRRTVVRLLEFYDLCGLKSDHTDQHWGWASLKDVRIIPTYDGRFQLTLPAPMAIH